ncbi:MAG: diguanylate cyclase, partial [Gammaproteobacteria bacterium]
RPARSLRLGLWIPLLLAVSFAGLAGTWAYLEEAHLRQRHQREHEQRWREELARLQPQLERLLLQGHRSAAEELVASYGTDPHLKALAVTGPAGRVLLATRLAWRGGPATALPGYRPEGARAAAQAGRLRLAVRGGVLEAYLPLAVGLVPGELREARQGQLYLCYDLSHGLAETRALLLQELRSLAPAALLALALAWFLLHRYLRRPLRALEAHTRELAAGHFPPVPVTGEGELARLARAFTEMGERLEASMARLRREEARYRGVLQALQDGVFLAREGRYVEGNEAFFRILGRRPEEVLGRPIGSFSPAAQPGGEASRRRVEALLERVLGGEPVFLTWTVQRPDGSRREVEVNAARLDLGEGPHEEPYVVASVRDVTERRRAERERQRLLQELRRQEELLRLSNRAGRIGTWEWDLASGRIRWSEGVEAIYGLAPGSLRGDYALDRELVHPADRERVQEAVRAAVQEGRPFEVEHRVRRADGSEGWMLARGEVVRDAQGLPCRLRGTVQDVTERRRIQEEVERLAYHDPLSGLANRRLLLDRLRQALARHQRDGRGGALLFIDLDRFKPLNDALGHRAGDRVLQEAARRIQALLREVDTVARLGGDEFVALLPGLGREPGEVARGALRAAERIRDALREGYAVEGHRFHMGASVGVALYPQDGREPEALLHHADAAMYRAKARGRGSIAFYHPSFQEEADQRLALEQGLRAALEEAEQGTGEGQLRLHYQLQVDRQGRPVAAEALLRWREPGGAWIPPGRFVPVAEDAGLILPLGRLALERAVAQCAAWRRQGWAQAQVAVNVSPVQFRQADFAQQVARVLERHGLPGGALTLEITEGMLVEDAEESAARLAQLKALGLRLSVDDFGTGYSSLAYLTRLPLDELKIDRAFVAALGEGSGAAPRQGAGQRADG